jgi:hypothetical protein
LEENYGLQLQLEEPMTRRVSKFLAIDFDPIGIKVWSKVLRKEEESEKRSLEDC